MWRAAGKLLVRRVVFVFATVAVVVMLAFIEGTPPVWLLATVCLGLGVVVAVEHFLCVRGGRLG
jgi:hypothetical protein